MNYRRKLVNLAGIFCLGFLLSFTAVAEDTPSGAIDMGDASNIYNTFEYVSTSHYESGYTGSGYLSCVNKTNAGFTVQIPYDANQVEFRYSSKATHYGPGDYSLGAFNQGSTLEKGAAVKFAETGAWNSWGRTNIPLDNAQSGQYLHLKYNDNAEILVDWIRFQSSTPPATNTTPQGCVDLGNANNSQRFKKVGIATNHSGYTGQGFLANTDHDGHGFAVQATNDFGKVRVRYAADSSAEGQFHVGVFNDDQNLQQGNKTKAFPTSGSWSSWTTNEFSLTGLKGRYLHMKFDQGGGFNPDWIEFISVDNPTPQGCIDLGNTDNWHKVQGDVTVETIHSGYTGEGFLDDHSGANGALVTIAIPRHCNSIRLKYSNDCGSNTYYSVAVADSQTDSSLESPEQIELQAGTSWSDWQTNIHVVAGLATNKYLQLKHHSGEGLDFDWIKFTTEAPTPEGCIDLGNPANSQLFRKVGIATNHSGYTGQGFLANTDHDGHGFAVQATNDFGKVRVRYAADSSAEGQFHVGVFNDDQSLQQGNKTRAFPKSGSWSSWTTNEFSLTGLKGRYLHMKYDKGGGFNPDWIEFIPGSKKEKKKKLLSVPNDMVWQGQLVDGSGTPLQGKHDLTFTLKAGGTNVVRQTVQNAAISNGQYAVVFTNYAAAFAETGSDECKLEIETGGKTTSRRILSVPYCYKAYAVTNVQKNLRISGGTLSVKSLVVDDKPEMDKLTAPKVETARLNAKDNDINHSGTKLSVNTLTVNKETENCFIYLPKGYSSEKSVLGGILTGEEIPSSLTPPRYNNFNFLNVFLSKQHIYLQGENVANTFKSDSWMCLPLTGKTRWQRKEGSGKCTLYIMKKSD